MAKKFDSTYHELLDIDNKAHQPNFRNVSLVLRSGVFSVNGLIKGLSCHRWSPIIGSPGPSVAATDGPPGPSMAAIGSPPDHR